MHSAISTGQPEMSKQILVEENGKDEPANVQTSRDKAIHSPSTVGTRPMALPASDNSPFKRLSSISSSDLNNIKKIRRIDVELRYTHHSLKRYILMERFYSFKFNLLFRNPFDENGNWRKITSGELRSSIMDVNSNSTRNQTEDYPLEIGLSPIPIALGLITPSVLPSPKDSTASVIERFEAGDASN